MSCDVGGHIGFSFTREHRQNGEGQREACGMDRTTTGHVDGSATYSRERLVSTCIIARQHGVH